MWLGFLHINNVRDFDSAHFQEIGNQRAMAAPPNRFRAHYCYRADLLPELKKPHDAILKFFRLHVIGVAAECFVAPGSVVGIGFRFAPSAELREMFVTDSGFA